MSRESARAQMVAGAVKTTKSQSLFGAGILLLIVCLAAGIAAGFAERMIGLDGQPMFGIIQFSIFAAAGILSFSVFYAASILAQGDKEP